MKSTKGLKPGDILIRSTRDIKSESLLFSRAYTLEVIQVLDNNSAKVKVLNGITMSNGHIGVISSSLKCFKLGTRKEKLYEIF